MSELKLQQCRLDGRYDVLECLGRGSYAEVYVARDAAASNGAPHTIVIKALNTFLQGVPDSELERTLTENFRNEAVALDRVRHPNIISRLGHGTAIDLHNRTFHYLVLEYLSGGDLQALCRHHPLTLDRALFYFEQVCAGLDHAHRHGVIHRDIKPQNLLLTADREVIKIADFGVAKIESVEGAITRVGTDIYAAPEHHPLIQTGPLDIATLSRPAKHLTPAADVYSLAKTTYMLLTGEAPRRFSQKPITELPESVADKEWAKFVLHVLNRATQTNQELRYQTVGAFWEELRDATMPRTQLLTSANRGGDASITLQRGAEDDARPGAAAKPFVAPVAPPHFEPHAASTSPDAARAEVRAPARPRIVVQIGTASMGDEREAGQRDKADHAHAAAAARPGYFADLQADAERARNRPRLSARARNWLVALLLIVTFAGMLYALHHYVSGYRAGGFSTGSRSPLIGREFLTITDVNLRENSSRSSGRVGLAEDGSRVRVLNVVGSWYEVQVIEHSREKEDSNSADRGWLDSRYLRAR